MEDLPQTLGRRYILQTLLGEGGMGTVYQALDRLTQQAVALKRLPTRSSSYTDLSPQATGGSRDGDEQKLGAAANSFSLRMRVALAREFSVLSLLHHPNIIRVLDYGFGAKMEPFFTMELLPAPQTLVQAAAGLSIEGKIDLLVQLLRALVYLHRHGILHRDLKPSNVLVVGREVKVLDFGIATRRSSSAELAGTIEYMAPELLIGGAASTASDLYAVGILAAEALGGAFPYDRGSTSRMLAQLLGTAVDLTLPPDAAALVEQHRARMGTDMPLHSAVAAELAAPLPEHSSARGLAELPPALRQVIGKLLARRPEERFQDAAQALRELCLAAKLPLAAETQATRESLLQSSPLMGRQMALEKLREATERMISGQGACILLAGESGIGKSRLLSELRTLALVRGVQVLTGQAVQVGGEPYQEFRNVLWPLCLDPQLSDFEAGVLHELLPDLDTLLGRSVLPAPELDAQSTRARLHGVVESILKRQGPTLLILEDLQWAGDGCVALLKRLTGQLDEWPLLVVASYRVDERPHLDAEIPQAQQLRLSRLQQEDIRALCSAMLDPAACTQELVVLLERESEGNPLFLVEILRTLAEEAGSLDLIGAQELPQRVVTGGIRAVLERRLSVIPKARRMLTVAAVAGRTLDLNILQKIEPAAASVLGECAEAAILELHGDRWRFTHDQLRDTLLAQLSSTDRRALHRSVADAIIKTYPEPDQHATALAYHCRESGQLSESAHFSVVAAEQALRSGAMTEAMTLLEQARAVYSELGATPRPRARVHGLLLQACVGLGKLSDGLTHAESALVLLGAELPHGGLLLGRRLAEQTLIQIAHRVVGPMLTLRAPPLQGSAAEDALQVLSTAGESCVWLGRIPQAMVAMLWGLNLSESLRDVSGQALHYGQVAYLAFLAGLPRVCDEYLRLGSSVVASGSGARAEYQFRRMSGLINMCRGRWEPALAEMSSAESVSQRIGDDYAVLFTRMTRSGVLTYRGQYDALVELLEELSAQARRLQNHQYQAQALAIQSTVLLRRGEAQRAASLLAQAEREQGLSHDVMGEVYIRSTQALCLVALGDVQSAEQAADAALWRLRQRPGPSTHSLTGLSALAETYLHIARHAQTSGQHGAAQEVRRHVRPRLQQVLKLLSGHARVIPIGQGRAALWNGICALEESQPLRAERLLRSSVTLSRSLAMPYEEAQAHRALAALGRAQIGRHPVRIDAAAEDAAAESLLAPMRADWKWSPHRHETR
ncbi:MAG: protein kinase [Polyangia bacterium]